MLEAERRSSRPAARRSSSEKRHLVGEDRDAVLDQHAQVVGVEIGGAEMGDQPFAPQRREFAAAASR